MGKPVVATDVGSLPEVVFGNYVLVTPADAQALAEGIIKVFKKEYDTSGDKEYLWEEAVRRHLRAYENLSDTKMEELHEL